MSVNNTQGTKKQGVMSSVLNQAKNMAIGGAIGGVAGKAVSLAAPVSHNKIAVEIADHYIKTNKDGLGDIIKNAVELSSKNKTNNTLKQMLETIQKYTPDEFDRNKDSIKKALTNAGDIMAEGVEYSRENVLDGIKKFLKNNEVPKEQLEKALKDSDGAFAKIMETATKKVKDFYSLARKQRPKDDIVRIAKKCAKEVQTGKIVGAGILAGVVAAIFSDMFSGIFTKKAKNAQQAPVGQFDSKIQTHQG